MSRIVEREYVETDGDAVVADRSFFASPAAIALAVLAVVLLLWLLIAAPFSDGGTTRTDQPTTNTAPVNEDRETGTGAGGDQTGGETEDPGNSGNMNSDSNGGADAP